MAWFFQLSYLGHCLLGLEKAEFIADPAPNMQNGGGKHSPCSKVSLSVLSSKPVSSSSSCAMFYLSWFLSIICSFSQRLTNIPWSIWLRCFQLGLVTHNQNPSWCHSFCPFERLQWGQYLLFTGFGDTIPFWVSSLNIQLQTKIIQTRKLPRNLTWIQNVSFPPGTCWRLKDMANWTIGGWWYSILRPFSPSDSWCLSLFCAGSTGREEE